jgi:hypothetical protein
MRAAFFALVLFAFPAFAADGLNFDIAKLCDWQKANTSMDVGECTAMEMDAQKSIADLEAKADAQRKTDCTTEAKNYSGDSGYASYTVYAACLKDGPGSQ